MLASDPVHDPEGAVQRPRAADPDAIRAHLDALTKPPGSLGRLEELALRLALVYGDPPPPLRRRSVLVLAGDHGVARRGVSAYPPEVTAQMCRNLASGGAAACVLARAVDADLLVADLGVDADLEDVPGLAHRKVGRGTRDLASGPAMTPGECDAAITAGRGLAMERLGSGAEVLALGDMGIGNTTSASALTAAILGLQGDRLIGPGTGATGVRLRAKRTAVERGLERVAGVTDPLRLLQELGGFEIAGMVGAILAAARAGRVVVIDGFVVTAASLVATRLSPAVVHYLVAAHRSAEPGHTIQLEALGLVPLLDLNLRLGEGTGALLALPLLTAAAGLLRDMATFESAGIAGPAAAPS